MQYLYPYRYKSERQHVRFGTERFLVCGKEVFCVKKLMEKLEHLLELGGIKKDVTLLVLSGIAVVLSLAGVQPLPFDIA